MTRAIRDAAQALLANIAVLGLNLKIYTEILKDKKMDARTTPK